MKKGGHALMILILCCCMRSNPSSPECWTKLRSDNLPELENLGKCTDQDFYHKKS